MVGKAANVLIAILGLLVVAWVIVLGVDVYRAARTGPRWKRRLIGAALTLLAVLGLPAPGRAAEAPPPAAGRAATLEDSPGWKTVTDAWATATPLAKSGKSTTAQRKAADAKLNAAAKALKRLGDAGLLAPEEAQLLATEANNIRQDIYRNPPTDCKVTCYSMAYVPPAQKSLERLAGRLPLVEKLVAGRKVHRAACISVLEACDADLLVLSDPGMLRQLPPERRKDAEATRDKARVTLRQLTQLLGLDRPMCYMRREIRHRSSQSQRQLDDRLKLVDALEREGKLRPVVVALVREAIERERPS